MENENKTAEVAVMERIARAITWGLTGLAFTTFVGLFCIASAIRSLHP